MLVMDSNVSFDFYCILRVALYQTSPADDESSRGQNWMEWIGTLEWIQNPGTLELR